MIDCIPLWIAPASDLIVAVAAVVTAYVAFRGLQTWKKQIRGQSEYECAKRLLASIRHMQYAIESARSPLGFSSEEGGISGMFDDRSRIMDAAFLEMRTHGVDAEVLWGNEKIAGILNPISKCGTEWKLSVGHYCRLHEGYSKPHRPAMPPEIAERYGRLERIVYGTNGDPFHNKLLDAVSEAEAFLRPWIEVK